MFIAKNLSCKKGDQYLFRNLSFSISPGELLFVKGPNGSGKTSLLKILAGLSSPDKGSLIRGEMSYCGHKEGHKAILTPFENIKNYCAIAGVKESKNEIIEVLTQLEIFSLMHIPCQRLSAGQRKKVALSSLILSQKKIWIVDEPFTSLDSRSIEKVSDMFKGHLKQGGAMIMASHSDFIYAPCKMIDLQMSHMC